MAAQVMIYETVDGVTTTISMFPIDAAHAVKVDPERYSLNPPVPQPAPALPEGSDEGPEAPEGVLELPALPRKPGRPPKNGGAA